MSYHPILEKNIQKLLPQELLSIEAVQQLLAAISRNFTSFERDKKITEHAFDVSETEYQQATRDLKTQNEIRKESIKKLKQAIRSLDPKAPQQFSDDDNDLIHIISFLEDQIRKTKALEQELINAKNAAEKAAMAKSEFLSVMSHEIRTPLNAIIGTIMLLQYQDLQPDQKELLNVMEISAENLLSLINDVLDYSKLEEGKIIFAERNINILHFLKNIKMANRVKAEEKGNLIKVIYDDDIPEFVVGDDVRLGQILNNLVSNAVKFTKEGTITIRVELKKSCKTDLELGFSIEDTGIGIPKEKQELIFERFTQANNNITREFGGSGLGLTIIRRLLQLQGSDIFIDSEPGIGSRFFFNLKFKKSTTEIREEAKQSGDLKFDLSGTHILLVEDVEFNVMVAQRMLRNWHATVDHAENGAVAVEKVKSNEYDLVLMDIQMPIMDGYTATNEIRKFNMALPIIALTASIITPDIQGRAAEAGMNGCITKPFNPNDLYSIIAEKSRKNK
ncbi:MAG: ATP-binding protein [Sediminibacterium sp.]|jgi:signal transduction histidine kinase/ActR/RegA family two-component response regulator|nr:response regulator [Chitinophagaceae bacterium]MCA6445819.1 response regulator [Chitinophagaceae bacterium]